MNNSKNTDIGRREFLLRSALCLSAALALDPPASEAAQALDAPDSATDGLKSLVVLHLRGGIDGLSALIPYNQGVYHDRRGALAASDDGILAIDDTLALPESLSALHELFKAGNMAIVPSAGYADHSRSHYRASDVWQSASPDTIESSGWLGRYLDLAASRDRNTQESRLQARCFQNERPLMLATRTAYGSKRIAGGELAPFAQTPGNAVENDIGSTLRAISKEIISENPAAIYTLSMDGFDTHANQNQILPALFRGLSDSINDFQTQLESAGKADKVLLLVFSEFGRRLTANDSDGTDHGSCAPVFLIGESVRGGVYGEQASLSDLQDGDMRYETDFRSVYGTILERWFDADSREVLGSKHEIIDFLA